MAQESSRDLPTIELVRRAKGQDQAARDELFARYSERVLPIARVRLGAKLRGTLEPEDILQDALLEALRGIDKFEMHDESSLIRWLAVLVEHRISKQAHYLRAAKRAGVEVPLEPEPDRDSEVKIELSAGLPTPSVVFARREVNELVQGTLSELPERYRELVLLRDYAGSSWEEIAQELGFASPDAARMMHTRALTRLGAFLRMKGISAEDVTGSLRHRR